MSEVEINGNRYMIGRMNVFDQAHVARKVAPVVTGMSRGYLNALTHMTMNGEEFTQAQENEIVLEAFGPVTEILSKMAEEDVNYIIRKCLGVCSLYSGQGFAPLVRSGNLMFEEQTDLATMLRLVMEVVKDNLGPSMRGLIPLFSGAMGSTSPSSSPT